jgi:dTMP kinase
MRPGRGKFITLEGIEGVGKSTQLEHVADLIRAAGNSVVCTREPGGTPLAENIRDLLLIPSGEQMPPSGELLLMFAARAVHLENLIRPALERGDWVVCDRFTDATYAYQGFGRGVARAEIGMLERLVQGELRPDLTILLDTPVDVGLARARKRGEPDRFESEKAQFFERVRCGYLEIAAAEPDRVRVVDAAVPIAEVNLVVATLLEKILK